MSNDFNTTRVAQQKRGRPITHRFHKSKYSIHPDSDKIYQDMEKFYWLSSRVNLANKHLGDHATSLLSILPSYFNHFLARKEATSFPWSLSLTATSITTTHPPHHLATIIASPCHSYRLSNTATSGLSHLTSSPWPPSSKIGSAIPRLKTAEDLESDDLLLHDAEMEVMNMILLSIPNEIYNSVDACTSAKDMWKRVEPNLRNWLTASRAKKLEKSHDPLALVAHTGSSSRQTSSYYVTSYYQQDDVHNNSEDPLVSAINQAIIPGDRVNIQSRNSGNTGRNSRRAYVQEEVVEGMDAPKETGNVQRTLRTPSSGNTSTVQYYNYSGKGHYARNYPKLRVRDSKYFMEQMLLAKQDEAGVILTDEYNDFLFVDASRMEEIEELSANICLMARIQLADHTSDDGPSYESAFISEVQSSSIDENNEPMYPTHTKIINSTIGKMGSNEEIRRLAQEAEKQQLFAQKVQQQNMTLTSQLELYKERNRILEGINKDNNYLNEFLEADERAKRYNKQAQSQLVRDRDIIRDLEKQRDKLELDVKDYKRQKEEYQKTQKIFNQTQCNKEEKYLDDILQLQAKIKDFENVVCKMGKSTETLRLLTNEQKAFRDNLRKSGLGYNGPYVLLQAYAKIPKLYNAYELCNKSEQLHVFNSEETLEDAFKSQ
ncbi:hypothetical protein Tco_1068041 [Tanacetum coccineum]|uniref:Uncharacterized protein n=1 Tax=Tanacetum coccineum TaxID=301880 RepID=A0ABQ5HFX8_9ASTR